MSIKFQFTLRPVRQTGGYTLAEIMIASAIASIVGLILAVAALHTVYSFKAISNYVINEQESRTANDWLSRDIRRASGVTQTSVNNITLSITNGPVTYAYDVTGHTVTRQTPNEAKVLLSGCMEARFTIYQENAIGAAYEQFTPGTNAAKLIGYYWHCGTTNNNGTVNSTDAQSALVVMRN
jgi:Tfp pilus assembly protein PilW